MSTAELKGIKSALKRAKSMGADIEYRPEFSAHRIAACVSNYSDVIETECDDPDRDELCLLTWLSEMAKRVNEFCDSNMVKDDPAAQYWLNKFYKTAELCEYDFIRAYPLPSNAEPSLRSQNV